MRLLLTRAEDDAALSAARLAARGHECALSPLLRVEDIDVAVPAGPFDAIAMTSARAARSQTARGLDPALKTLPLWLVGRRTLEAARAAGFEGPARVAPAAGALLVDLGEQGGGVSALYLAGADRKPDLEAGLSRRGIVAAVCEVYRACAAPELSDEAVAALAGGRIDAVLHFSRRSADLFIAAADRASLSLGAVRHFCLSRDVAAPLFARGAATEIAATASEAALFDLAG